MPPGHPKGLRTAAEMIYVENSFVLVFSFNFSLNTSYSYNSYDFPLCRLIQSFEKLGRQIFLSAPISPKEIYIGPMPI